MFPPTCRYLMALLALFCTGPGNAANPTYRDIAPILQSRCVLCHGGALPPLELRLGSLDELLRGSQNGPIVRRGNPTDSELIRRLKGTSQPRMPLTGPPFLSDAEIALFERWIAAGLPPGEPLTSDTPAGYSPASAPNEPVTYSQVQALLLQRCASCHSANGRMGAPPEGYVLSSYPATLAFDERARVVPGHPNASELVRRIRGHARPRMPYDGPPYLDDAQVALITRWVAQGARDAQGTPARLPTGAKVRLHGTLREHDQLDDLPLRIDAETRIDKSPLPGDYVQVRGRIRADGSVQVERIRRR